MEGKNRTLVKPGATVRIHERAPLKCDGCGYKAPAWNLTFPAVTLVRKGGVVSAMCSSCEHVVLIRVRGTRT